MFQAIYRAGKKYGLRYRGGLIMTEDTITAGVVGTMISASGAIISVNEVQALVSIIVTVLGFIISVLIPLILKLIHKVKKAKKDGKIDEDEIEDIISTGQEILDETKKFTDKMKDKHAGDDK